jgi:uncharacterized protein YajQ (UPF0234 family)
MPSFDVVSKLDLQEVDNAVNQTRKEVDQRYDFKGTRTEIAFEGEEIRIDSSDEHRVAAVVDVLQSKLVKRGVSLKSLEYGRIEPASGSRVRQTITLQQGIAEEKAKQITKRIKESKLKVQAQIQADQVRITGKNRDDLQAAIQLLKQDDVGLPLQFVNFRD